MGYYHTIFRENFAALWNKMNKIREEKRKMRLYVSERAQKSAFLVIFVNFSCFSSNTVIQYSVTLKEWERKTYNGFIQMQNVRRLT